MEGSGKLSAASTSALQAAARKHQLTASTFVQAAWALLLSRHSGQTDVVFGAAFSGRPADLDGVESMVGPFVNNLPVRSVVKPEQSALDFLKQLHARQLESNQHQFNSVLEIQSWSEVSWRHRLFDSLLVFQNYVVDDSASRLGSQIEIYDFVSPVRTNYPLTLVVVPGVELALTLICPAQQLDEAAADKILVSMTKLLAVLAADPATRLEELLALLPAAPARGDPSDPATPRSTSQNHVAAQNETERLIAQVWQEAFGLERISTRDNFFDLGGQSLLMVQVHAKLREVLKLDLSIVKMFQYPTINSLARHLTQAGEAEPALQKAQDRAQRQKAALARQRPLMRK